MPDFAYDVFLSHNRGQKGWTLDLARRLRVEGFEVWFDEWCLRGGENWIVGLRRGVTESRHVVFVVSPESIGAVWPLFEVYLAIFHDPLADDRKLIPIIHTPCELPDEIALRHHIDFSETHDDPPLYEFRLQQLMADLDPSRERPTDFELWVQEYEGEESDGIPPVRPLPRGSMMPLRANPHFVGREDQLQELETYLRAGSTAAIGQVAAATGLGGIGKTQLAVEYAHRYGRRYAGGVFWLDMEDAEAIASQVARCGGPEGMDLPAFEALSRQDQLARVKTEWEKATPRLVIFDNVDDSNLINEWRPVTGGCRVLLTSRRTEWPSALGIEEVRLATLPRDKAVELLCKGRPEALEDEEGREAADAICETLGDLPLAVALAGAYLETYKYDVTLTQYLEQLRAQPVLENPALVKFVKDPSPTDHVQNVAATFEVSYQRLDADDETDLLAMRLFHLASHFAPVSIRRDLLFASAGLDPEVEEERRLAAGAVERLTRLGLMEEEAQGRLLLHRLLGEFARHHPAPGQSEGEAWEAVAETIDGFTDREYESGLPTTLGREVAHLMQVAAEAERRESEKAGMLLNHLGLLLKAGVEFRGARDCFERALGIYEAAYGKDHPNVATVVNNLGRVLHDLGDLRGARGCLERALGIDEAACGKDHPRVATVVNNLGGVLGSLGDLSGARECFERALRIHEAAYGQNHPTVATDVNNLGMVLREMGDVKGARECFERALWIGEAAYGQDHPMVAAMVNNLGLLVQSLGDLKGARECFERALRIDEAVHGKEHQNVATVVNNLGRVLHDLGELEGARECFERALRIDEEIYGEEHPDVATDENNLGCLLHDMGNLKGARECLERALGIDEAAYGKDHPTVARDMNNLGSTLRSLGDLRGARECYERALRIDEAAYGNGHPNVARDVCNLGRVLEDVGDLKGARECYERSLGISEAAYGKNHPRVATYVTYLGLVLYDLGDLEGARECFEQAIAIYRRVYGQEDWRAQLALLAIKSLEHQ